MLHLNLLSLLSFWDILLQLFFDSTLIYPYWCCCWNKWYVYGYHNASDRDSVGYRSSQRCCCCRRITCAGAVTVDTFIICSQGLFWIKIASKFFPAMGRKNWMIYLVWCYISTILDYLKILLHHGDGGCDILDCCMVQQSYDGLRNKEVMMFQIVVWYNEVIMVSETTKLQCFRFLYGAVVLIIRINVVISIDIVSINVVVTSEFF